MFLSEGKLRYHVVDSDWGIAALKTARRQDDRNHWLLVLPRAPKRLDARTSPVVEHGGLFLTSLTRAYKNTLILIARTRQVSSRRHAVAFHANCSPTDLSLESATLIFPALYPSVAAPCFGKRSTIASGAILGR